MSLLPRPSLKENLKDIPWGKRKGKKARMSREGNM